MTSLEKSSGPNIRTVLEMFEDICFLIAIKYSGDVVEVVRLARKVQLCIISNQQMSNTK